MGKASAPPSVPYRGAQICLAEGCATQCRRHKGGELPRRQLMRRIASGWMVACALILPGPGLNDARAAEFYRLPDAANGVSPDGSIVLMSEHVWTRDGGRVRVPPPGVGTYSRDVSNNGFVVGLVDGNYAPFRTPVGGPLQVLDPVGGDAFGITPDGSVVVGYAYFNGSPQPSRWTASTGQVSLGRLSPPGTNGNNTARGVSADGSVVVGEGAGANGPEAFRWTQPAGMVGLGDLPGGAFDSGASGVSSDGRVVVGYSASAAGASEAFRWTQAGGMVGLGALPGRPFYSRAEATSADGAVVVGGASSAPGT